MERWERAAEMVGETVVDRSRHRIGKVRTLAEDPATMEPAFLVVKTSWFGRDRLIPIAAATQVDRTVEVPYSKETVVESPVPASILSLSSSEEDALARHYGRAA
jgi:hypothetical protein